MKKFICFLVACFCVLALKSQDHEYVDLGLPSGTLWATCNIGASTPNESGTFFAWGECEGDKSAYNETTYKYISAGKWQKYCTDATLGSVDNKTSLDPEDDAATCLWGEDWCMPSVEQVEELVRYCKAKETKQKRKKGLLFTGSNGNTIFIPYGGVRYKTEKLLKNESGCYWTKEISPKLSNIAAFFNLDMMEVRYHDRYNGYLIRPVRNK